MARLPRLFLAGCPNHIIQRGNNRSDIFFVDADRARFAAWLAESMADEGCALHAYVLMSNHIHLLVTADRPQAIPRAMQSLGRRYVQYVNRTYERTGTLWEGRFRSTLVDSERYLLACYRYIEANPIRAGLVGDAASYRWSSYRHNALGRHDALVTEHSLYQALGASPAERRAGYCALFAEGVTGALLGEIRDATQRGWVMGGEDLRARVASACGRRAAPPKRGRPFKVGTGEAAAQEAQVKLL